MKRCASILVVALGTIVFGTTRNSAAGDGAQLSPTQAAAKARFVALIEPAQKSIKEKCGVEIAVTSDYENYDEASWLKAGFHSGTDEEKRNYARDRAVSDCQQIVESLVAYCKAPEADTGKARDPKHASPAPAGAAAPSWKGPELKSVSCVFAGATPQEKNESPDDYTRRQMSFANGVLTVHVSPQLQNAMYNAWDILKGRWQAKNAPKKNGASCTENEQCRSGLCASYACKSCKTDAQCGGGRVCDTDDKCVVPSSSSSSEEPSSSSGGKTASKKSLGAKCSYNDECASKKCGTISDGNGLHKCIKR